MSLVSTLSPTPSITSAQSRALKDAMSQLKKNRIVFGNLKEFLGSESLSKNIFTSTNEVYITHFLKVIKKQMNGTCYKSMQLLEDIPVSDVSDVVESATAQPTSCCTTTSRRIGKSCFTVSVFWGVTLIVAFIALFSKTAEALHNIPAEYWTLFHDSLQWIYLGVAVMAVLGGCSLCYTCLKK